MKHLNFPILLSCLSIIAGIFLAEYMEVSSRILIVLLAVLLGLLILLHSSIKRSHVYGAFSFCTAAFFICAGFFLHKRILPKNTPQHYTQLTTGATETIFLEIKERLKPTSYQTKYVGSIKSINNRQANGLILINKNKDSLVTESLQVGDRLYIRSVIKEVPVPRNPYQFDYGNYLKRKRIYGQISISDHALLMSESRGTGIRVIAARFRESVQKKLTSYAFTQDQLAIINALILGQRQGIDKQMNKQYAAAGMMHILAVSGLHVGIILLLLRFITRPIAGYRLRFVRSGLIIVFIWSFAILTGGSPSVLRAATMFSFLEASTLFGSQKESSNALIASALVLLLLDPLLLYQVGFQLSYLAVLGILWIQPWLSGLLKIKNRIGRLFWSTATVTIAAQLGVMPLSLFYFHQFPGLFLVSNILVIPLLGFLLGTGILVVTLAVLDILPDFLITGFGGAIDLLNMFIGWVASKEEFVLRHISISVAVMLGLYLLIIASISLLKKYNFKRLMAAMASVLVIVLIMVFEKVYPQQDQFVVFHKGKQTLLGLHSPENLFLQTEDTLWDYRDDSRVNSLRDHSGLDSITASHLQNIISFKTKTILVIDSIPVYNLKDYIPDYILLTQSPNVNLERLIQRYPKASIIADGNNYKSDIDRWKATCRKRKIPFHSTYEKGAFILE